MTDKAEALEEIITLLAVPPINNLHRQAASMLTAQAAEIERLRADLERELKANRKLGDAYNAQAAKILTGDAP